MVKRLLPLITALALLAAGRAAAVELGELTLTSNSDEPLAATVALLDVQGLDADAIQVTVASAADFERLSLERDPALDNFAFNVNLNSPDGPVVTLSAPVSIDEPFLSLLLDTRWPTGRVLTEYTLRLESPAFTAQTETATEFAPVRSVALDVPEPDSDEVQAAATEQTTDAPAQPELAESVVVDAANADADADVAPGAATVAETESTQAPEPDPLANASTLTVNAGDTLWELALRARPDDSVSVQQTMLALQRLNPDAFIGGNINQVQRGAVLRVPEMDEIRRLGATEAVQEVQRQNQAFTNRATTPQPTQAASGAASGGSNQGELRVVAVDEEEQGDEQPDTTAAGNQDAEREQRLNELEDRLAVRQEELDRLDLENRELTARLDMLQQQIASAQEIIRLRDLELAQLQESLAEQAPQSPAAGESADDEGTVVTMAPQGGPVQQFFNALLTNTWLLLGVAAALILSLVLFLVWRNRAARAAEQESQRENDDMKLGSEDSDELLFAGVAAAAAEADASRQSDAVVDADAEAATEDRDTADAGDDAGPDTDDDDGVVYTPGSAAAAMADDEADREEPAESDWDDAVAEQEPQVFDDSTAPEQAAPTVDQSPENTELDALSDADTAWDDADSSAYDLDDEFDLNRPEEEGASADDTDEAGLDPELDTDLDWPEPEPEPEPEQEQEPEPEPASEPALGSETDSSLDDYDLSEPVTPPKQETASSETAADEFDDLAFIPTEELTADDAADEDEDYPFLSDSDEAATKLDLARAYIDMGDEDGAREILAEVLDEGTESQRQDAQALLDRLV